MFRRFSALGVAIGFLFVAGCSDDPKPTQNVCASLPQAPQILPNAQAGVVPFDLLTEGDMQTIDVVFVNGGQDPLVVSDIRVEGDDFTLVSVTPESQTVECAEALSATVRFESPGRGVYLGRLVVESNAGNFSSLDLELVGPSAASTVPDNPDIAVVESPVEVQEIAGLTVPAAVIRYYNLGADTLVVDDYTISNTADFRFLSGTEVPGADCTIGGACEPATGAPQGCCGSPQLVCSGVCQGGTNDGLACTEPCDDGGGGTVPCDAFACGASRVVSGDFVLFGVRFTDTAASGTQTTTTVNISSNDPDSPDVTVGVTGTP